MKKLVMFKVLAAILLGCSDSGSSPNDSNVYIYSSEIVDYYAVWTENEEEVPQNEWTNKIIEYQQSFLEAEAMLKTLICEIDWNNNSIVSRAGSQIEAQNFVMFGDTLNYSINFGEEPIYVPVLIKVDDNTLEFQSVLFYMKFESGLLLHEALDLSYYKPTIDEALQNKENLNENEFIALFAKRYIFKRK